jgi:predicted nucleic-acid-binding Zn-ribbon protein
MSDKCAKCGGAEFAEGTDYMAVRPLDKKLSTGSNKIYTFCLNCGEIISTRIENPQKFRK